METLKAMKRITITLTVETSLAPNELFHALAEQMGDHRFGENHIEGRAFFADDPKGADQAHYAYDLMRVSGSVESMHIDGESVGFSGRRKGGAR